MISVRTTAVLGLVATLLLISNTSAIAATASPAMRYQERRDTVIEKAETRQENRLERREEVEENMLERQGERQERRQERRDDFAERHAERLTNRFTFYYERLSTVMSKLKTRFEAMAKEGKNVAAAQAKLTEAQTALTKAKSLSDQAIAAFKSIDPAQYESQREVALKARDLAMQAREQFKTAVELLRESVKLAKEASV